MQDCARYVEEMTRLRREIHRRPEEGWTEFETQWKVFRALEALGWTIRMGLDVIRPEAVMGRNAELVEKAMVRAAEHGVPESFLKATGGYTGLTADFDTGCEGPVTGFRFDMDCVLVEELHDASHLPAAEGFDSEIPGHMHACGHDAHTATGVTLAHWITDHKDELKGRFRLIFQPAEEGEHGADEVIATGLVHDVDAFFGLHVWSLYPTGTLHATPGGIWAEPDMFKVTIHGKGGHGATPEVCVDAITAGAAVVQSLQTIVSRFISPMDSVVVTVGSFHAGTRCNIIAQDAVLEGTLRAFDDDVHRRLLEHFRRIITDVSAAYGCTAEIEINEVAGVVVNDEALCRIANECAAELVPPDRIQPQHPCMLGDDFASYRAIAPSCFVQVGMLAPEKDCRYAHHHGMFKVDEDVLPLCAAWMAAMAARAASR